MVHMKNIGINFIIISCVILAAVILTGCPPEADDEPTPTPTPAPTPVTAPAAPSNLTVTNTYPCEIQWADNSNNEDGFRIYIGSPCTNCDLVSSWILQATVGANVTSYTWAESCCSIAQCSCVQVRAYNTAGETSSNNTMLAPVCK